MKTKFSKAFLIIISFILSGCLAEDFNSYTFLGATNSQKEHWDTRISYNETTELRINCGNYAQFIKPKKRGILVRVKVVSKTENKKEL